MNKERKIPRYKRILALGDTSYMTSAEIADRLGLCPNDATVAIHHAKIYYGIHIPYQHRGNRKPKPPVAAKKAPQGKDTGKGKEEPQVRDWRLCEGCKYWKPLSASAGEGTMKACHYCHDTGRSRGLHTGGGCTKRESW